MAEQIKQTKINGVVIGTLEEKALTLETGVKKTSKDGKAYTTDIIKGKLVVDGFEIQVYCQSKMGDKENSMFKGIKTVHDTYVDKVEASSKGVEADTIEAQIRYECNDYASPSAAPTEIKTGTRISLFRATRVNADTPHKAELDFNDAVIRSIRPEMKNEEETARLIVEVATFDYSGKLKPFTFFVENRSEEEGLDTIVDDFCEIYEAGQTARLYAELRQVRVGGETSNKKSAFGRKVQVASGYTIIEAHIIGGEEPNEEENSYDLADVKAAMNQRAEELEVMLKEAQEKAKQPKADKGLAPKKSIGKRVEVAETADSEDDLPF